MLIRFKDERIENIPNVNDFIYAPSITLKPRHAGKMGEYAIPGDIIGREPFLVLEKIPGDNLEKLVAHPDFRPRAEIVALKCARELCTILLKLHKPFDLKGQKAYFIFQDMKPANLIVSGDDHFTLIDFGGLTLKLGNATTEPTAGVLTRGYMAPEALGGNEIRIDHRFDIYGLGATLYHIVTGVDPRTLAGESPVLDLRALVRAGVSQETFRVVARALERLPDKRYQTAAEMRRDVMAILQARGAA
jgi:serine/threonine-protein kinase